MYLLPIHIPILLVEVDNIVNQVASLFIRELGDGWALNGWGPILIARSVDQPIPPFHASYTHHLLWGTP